MKPDLDLRYANLPSISGGDQSNDPPEVPPVDPPEVPPVPPVDPEPFTDAQQLHVNAIVARETDKAVKQALKAIADEQAEQKKKDDAEREKAAKKILRDQGTLEERNTILTQEVDDLTTERDRLLEELADFHKDIESEYTTFRETMPPALSVFDVGESATPSAKRDFVSKGRQMIADLGAPFLPGNAPSPSARPPVNIPGGDDDDEILEDEARRLIKTNRSYNRF
jgi:hypothetical protein